MAGGLALLFGMMFLFSWVGSVVAGHFGLNPIWGVPAGLISLYVCFAAAEIVEVI